MNCAARAYGENKSLSQRHAVFL